MILQIVDTRWREHLESMDYLREVRALTGFNRVMLYSFDEKGKFHKGFDARFDQLANGMPGIEVRLPLLFSHGVHGGRISVNEFAALSATNAARLYGLSGRKGSIAVGLDADIAIWDPEKTVTITQPILHDKVGYTPYEGMEVRGWPTTVLSRGRVVVHEGELLAKAGSGEFIPAASPPAARRSGSVVPELDTSRNFGTRLNY